MVSRFYGNADFFRVHHPLNTPIIKLSNNLLSGTYWPHIVAVGLIVAVHAARPHRDDPRAVRVAGARSRRPVAVRLHIFKPYIVIALSISSSFFSRYPFTFAIS